MVWTVLVSLLRIVWSLFELLLVLLVFEQIHTRDSTIILAAIGLVYSAIIGRLMVIQIGDKFDVLPGKALAAIFITWGKLGLVSLVCIYQIFLRPS